MVKKCELREVFAQETVQIDEIITISGWIRNHRKQKKLGFIDFFDGTIFSSMQIVYDDALTDFLNIQSFRVGASITVTGKLVQGKNKEHLEIVASQVELLEQAPEEYPLQPKKHSLEFLREIAYLRPRTKLFQAIFRLRNVTSMAIHNYFQERGYIHLHSPILTQIDGEGAGEAFTVTTQPLVDGKQEINFATDFFGKKTSLAVTGQLEGEAFALAFKKVYTFGPTFRAENSNTKTHLAEFWMMEPEIAFCDLDQLMNIQEDFLKNVTKNILEACALELAFLSTYNNIDLIGRLNKLIDCPIMRITHKEAVTILLSASKEFEFIPTYDGDLAKEHEKYLTDVHFKGAVFVYDWPKQIKAFYMKVNGDQSTVAAVDLLVPGIGELMGGSQREANRNSLHERMCDLNISTHELEWYLNLRTFGSCEHSGFGLGFERLVMYLSGMENIRDVIPFPRTPMNCLY